MYLGWKILRSLSFYADNERMTPKFLFHPCFKSSSSGTCVNQCFLRRRAYLFYFTVESSSSYKKAPTIEIIIVILSVMCIVPKYHIVFCMIVILLILKYLFLVSFKTPKERLHLCFATLLGASEIPL